MTIAAYADIRTELNNYTLRAYTQAEVDTFLGLAQPKINRKLTGYQRQATATVVLASGVGNLPADFSRVEAVSYSTYGNLDAVGLADLTTLNPTGASGTPRYYAITGTQISVAPLLSGNVTMTYLAGVPALSGSNTTNWLLTAAPDAYFNAVLAEEKIYQEDFQAAALLESRMAGILSELNMQAVLAAYGRSGVVPRAVWP